MSGDDSKNHYPVENLWKTCFSLMRKVQIILYLRTFNLGMDSGPMLMTKSLKPLSSNIFDPSL